MLSGVSSQYLRKNTKMLVLSEWDFPDPIRGLIFQKTKYQNK